MLSLSSSSGRKLNVSKNITRAGIRAAYYKEDESPIILFITREHNYKKNYANLKKKILL